VRHWNIYVSGTYLELIFLSFLLEINYLLVLSYHSLKPEIMKYILVFLVFGIISCKKNSNNNNDIPQPNYQVGDTLTFSLKNNLSSDITNVLVGYVEWGLGYDDTEIKTFILSELGQIDKDSTANTRVLRKWQEVTVWFDLNSKTYMVPVAVGRLVGDVSQLSENMALLNIVEKSSNRYPH
jgi:hypothetical protein